MPGQLSLRFEEVPISCPTQERYHAIAPCLAGKASPAEQAEVLHLSYSTVSRWLRQCRDRIQYPVPGDQMARREEIVKLHVPRELDQPGPVKPQSWY